MENTFLEDVRKYKNGEVPYEAPSVIIFTNERELKLVKKDGLRRDERGEEASLLLNQQDDGVIISVLEYATERGFL